MSEKRVFILGAGLAGLSAAWHLQKKGIDCQIFEKEPETGGLCRSKKINGFTFDLDGHLLHFRHSYTFNLIKNLLGSNLLEHKRSAWVYSHEIFSRYPFQANLYGLPKSIAEECLLGFIEAHNNGHKKRNNNSSFYNWIINTFGEGIAQHFMVPYNAKFWTQHPEKLTCEWLHGFIPTPSLKEVIEGTIEESQRQFGYNARFWYPREGGINQVSSALTSQIRNISTNCHVVEIDLVKKEITFSSGNKEKFDYLISTIPLPEMPNLIRGIPKKIKSLFKKLSWNSIFNLNLGIDRKNHSGQHWIYFPQKETCFFRVGFFHNFSPSLTPCDKGSLYVEVAYSQARTIDKSSITLRIKEDLKNVGMLTDADKICLEDINDIKYGYPIYDLNYRKVRKEILEFLGQNNIIGCGRYGSWRYMSMEDVILDGRDTAAKIIRMV